MVALQPEKKPFPQDLGIDLTDFRGKLAGKCAGQHTGMTFLFGVFSDHFSLWLRGSLPEASRALDGCREDGDGTETTLNT
jgi:hypothetical protein